MVAFPKTLKALAVVLFAILLVATILGCWAFYLAGRRVDWLRPAIGLSRRGGDDVARTSAGISRLARS